MNIDIFDTYVTHADGKKMHFDVLLHQGGSKESAVQYAKQWLKQIGIDTHQIQLNQCQYCHSEVAHPEIEAVLVKQGYAILQMEGCPNPIY